MVNILIGVLPVLAFLAGLTYFDSFKLVRVPSVLTAIAAGCLIAGACYLVNTAFIVTLGVPVESYSRYGSPLVEEVAKAAYIVALQRRHKIGFMVDAAIYGFAVGAGFACAENVYYLRSLPDLSIPLWIVRGFGTAVMHGGTTAVVAIAYKSISDRRASNSIVWAGPGLVVASAIHSLYNHFFFPPVLSTLLLLGLLPAVISLVFRRSEQATREWLGMGFDTDVSVLEMITSGNLARSNIGTYLGSLRDRFPGEVVVDMLCLVRLHLELSLQAKGLLMMKEAGFQVPPDPQIKEKFAEMVYLRKSIGRTGTFAISPFLRTGSRDLWQFTMLGGSGG